MRILIANDDGIHAPGILALARTMASVGDVTVVAPDRQRSAFSHAISLHRRLVTAEIDYGRSNITAYSLNGTPVDCVKWAICELAGDTGFDIMLSGINEGRNLAQDVLYSGTVAAAGEAALQHIPAMAVSLDGPPFHYQEAAELVKDLLSIIPMSELGPDNFLNVNIPKVPRTGMWKVAALGARQYTDKFERRMDEHGDPYYVYAGEPAEELVEPDVDTKVVAEGFVSITPLRYRFTNEEMLATLNTWIVPNHHGAGES